MVKFRIYIKFVFVFGQVSVCNFLVLSLFKIFYKFFICSQKFAIFITKTIEPKSDSRDLLATKVNSEILTE